MDELAARVRMFVAGGASVAPTSILRNYFAQLPPEGWLIELSRAHLRALRKEPFPHEEFAAWIGLRGTEIARDYRRMLRRPEADREELVQLARRALRVSVGDQIGAVQTSAEMVRFRRARETVERMTRSSVGRPTEPHDTSGPITFEVERKRCELRISVEDWSGMLGSARATYLSRLLKERDRSFREKIADLAKDAATLHVRLSTPAVAKYPPITKDEMTAAYQRVADDMDDLRVDALDGIDASSLTDAQTFEPLDLYQFLRPDDNDDDQREEFS